MSRYIIHGLGHVVSATNNTAVAYHYATYRNLVMMKSLLSLLKGKTHIAHIVIHQKNF
jgi:hypothetical protein